MTVIKGGVVKINAGGGGGAQAKANLKKMSVAPEVEEFGGFTANVTKEPSFIDKAKGVGNGVADFLVGDLVDGVGNAIEALKDGDFSEAAKELAIGVAMTTPAGKVVKVAKKVENIATGKSKTGKIGEKNTEAPVLKGRRPKTPKHPVKNKDGSLTEYGEWYYKRPSGYRKGVREEAFDNAKGSDKKVRDPLTKEEIKFDDEWDMGHKPKQEFRKHKADAAEKKIGRKEFLDEHNNPKNYRPETPNTNRSHKLEDVTDAFE
jgi:hypothetical protein